MSVILILLLGSITFAYCFSVIAFLFYHISNQEEGFHLELSIVGRLVRFSFLSPDYQRNEPDPWNVNHEQSTHQWSDAGWDLPELIETETFHTAPTLQEVGEQLAEQLATQLLTELEN